jgi:hypothetical protein
MMGISELLKIIGDDNIIFQNLDECAISMDYDEKKGTDIKFGTNEKLNMDGTVKLGLVVWLDRDKVKAAIKSVSVPKTSTVTNEE